MRIKISKTNNLSPKEWISYQKSFNTVFNKNRNLNYFKHKYNNVSDGYSYHAILLNNNNDVVGGCSVLPMLYNRNDNIVKIGQAVDVFILEDFRTDPLMLKKMYSKLKELLIANNILAVLAVPNAVAFPYWINVVKWDYIGDLKYWMIPVKLGTLMNKSKVYNSISILLVKCLMFLNNICSLIYPTIERKSTYELIDDEKFIDYRYNKNYEKITHKNITFYFRTYIENNIKTTYLIDAKQKNRLTYRALVIASRYIVKNTNSDLIIYVGPIKLFQLLFMKVPKIKEPKKLPLICDILDKNNVNLYSDMLNLKNWNFGLKNFDVR